MDKKVITKNENGVLIVQINREAKRNAIDPETAKTMDEILTKAEASPDVRAIVLTGTGDRSFCAGEDLSVFSESGECETVTENGFAGVTNRFFKKPLICAANGTAVAGGMEIALACDLIIASEDARFGLSEVKVGLIASTGGLIRLARDIPKKIAMEMILTGNLISAQRAYEVGLINLVVPQDQVLSKAIEYAGTIAKNAPLSLEYSKKIFQVAPHLSEEDAQKFSDLAWSVIEKTDDAIEGSEAFVEKRDPRWTGK